MKKRKKIGLILNKKVISNLKTFQIKGGDTLHTCAGSKCHEGGPNTDPGVCISDQLQTGCNGN